MTQFGAFVQKEFYHIFRDKRTIMILLIMPIIQILLFGFAISTEVNNIRVAFFDPSKDISTCQIKDKIAINPYFSIVETINTPHDMEELFRKGKVDLIINFENNFRKNLYHSGKASIQLMADATDPNRATIIINYTKNILLNYQKDINKITSATVITPEVRLLYNPQMKSAYNFVPGVMGLILMLICAMMTSISIVREKEKGTMEVLLASPIKPIYIILAKSIPYLVLSLMNLFTILILSVFVLDVPIAGNLFWLCIVSLLFIFVALSLGLLISTLVNSQVAAMLASGMVLMMPVMLLSGMIFPIESMPVILQWISNIIPARWFISAVKKIMIEGLSIDYALKEISILTGMALLILVVSLKKFSYRVES